VGHTLPATLTVNDALDGLPTPSAELPGTPVHHVAAAVGEADKKRIHALGPGQTMRDLPEELWHESYRRRAYRRVMDGTPTERRGGAPAGIRRLRGDEPSKAITGAAHREFIHPEQDRPLTLRECARIQTFHDDFEFIGHRAEVATMIGNAVPPSFARAIGLAIAKTLQRPVVAPSTTGRLVRFDATAAEGMSPALARVVNAVELRYGLRRQVTELDSQQELLWA
jgi:DNA (cytosine-5)-methyltransferase 1